MMVPANWDPWKEESKQRSEMLVNSSKTCSTTRWDSGQVRIYKGIFSLGEVMIDYRKMRGHSARQGDRDLAHLVLW